jgi:hypothetical protein
MDLAASELGDVSRAVPPHEYRPLNFAQRFADGGWRTRAVEHGGVLTSLLGNTAIVAAHPSSASPGFVTFRIDAGEGRTFDDGLWLELFGRAFVHRRTSEDVSIRVLAGADAKADSMTEVARLYNREDVNEPASIDLSSISRGRASVLVRVELHAATLPPEHLDWCAVPELRFTRGWPAALTTGLPPQDNRVVTQRKRNLLVSWRRDAELAIDDFPAASSVRVAAKSKYDAGDYANAYRTATRDLAAAR